jgi:hypothetical protein
MQGLRGAICWGDASYTEWYRRRHLEVGVQSEGRVAPRRVKAGFFGRPLRPVGGDPGLLVTTDARFEEVGLVGEAVGAISFARTASPSSRDALHPVEWIASAIEGVAVKCAQQTADRGM